MDKKRDLIIPASNVIYADIMHWVTIIVAIASLLIPVFVIAMPQNSMLNPNLIFAEIFSGASPAEIWELTETGNYPGAHFYFDYSNMIDSYAMLAINIGCSVGVWALIPTVIYQVYKEKDWFSAITRFALLMLIILSMLGILSIPA